MIVRVHYPNPFSGGFGRFEYEADRPPGPGTLRRAAVPRPDGGDGEEIVEITHVAEGPDGMEAVGILRLDALGDLRVLSVGGVWDYLPVVPDIHRPALLGVLRRLFRAIPDAGEAGGADLAQQVDAIGESFRPLGGQLPGVGPRIRDLIAIIKGRSHLSALQAFFDAAPDARPEVEAASP
ncbi:hypothetical protein GXW71_33790 [Roseomonas hellenica]|uniref:Inorganic diphosphatase n=1 Tax=Plastoroseomonas hellenica TaxID=2687306 RepID=A0ABS5FA48_9PROT|nr:hypothetical protein [Plastoroseomonas hellenica]MBR0669371.1 hypothetical protein [Plastoroseomonas hellenica]